MQEVERSNLPGLREILRNTGQVIAEIDLDLRYVWIDNPHPDFDPADVVGKRDDELIPPERAEELLSLKREVLRRAQPIQRSLSFERSDGRRSYRICAYPVRNAEGKIDGILTVGFELPGS